MTTNLCLICDLRAAYLKAKRQSERRLNAVIFACVVFAGVVAGIGLSLLARVLG